MNYIPELKDALLRRMLPPNNESITKISREEGISEKTLRNWRDKARKEATEPLVFAWVHSSYQTSFTTQLAEC